MGKEINGKINIHYVKENSEILESLKELYKELLISKYSVFPHIRIYSPEPFTPPESISIKFPSSLRVALATALTVVETLSTGFPPIVPPPTQ